MTPVKPPRKNTPQARRPAKKTIRRWSHNHLIILMLVVSFTLTIFITSTLYLLVALHLPDIKSLASYRPPATSLIFSDQGEIIGRSFVENRSLVVLKKLPKLLPKAFIAAEDARFFQHGGVDAWSILRAVIHNIKAGTRGQGGSTITQQVARSLLLTPEKTYTRKIKEAILAYRIDKVLSKDEIIHIYLNQIYLGEGAYGIEAAAQTYFGKKAALLNLSEITILAGLPQAPSRYSPFKHIKRAKRRQAYVLNRMAEDGYITPTTARKAYSKPLSLSSRSDSLEAAGYFVQYIKNYITKKYGRKLLNNGGLRIYTTLDLTTQRAAAKAVRKGVSQWNQRHKEKGGEAPPQAALICEEVKNSYVRALTGGVDFQNSQFDRATQARRQPGSAFKPIIYAAALTGNFTPNSLIEDEPIQFDDDNGTWVPRNYSGKFYGPTTLRTGLVHSRNIVTIKILQRVGTNKTIQLATKMGIHSPLNPNLSLALGSSELSLLELTSAYTVFANGGRFQPPIFIKKIIDRDGKILEEHKPSPRPTLAPEVAYQMTNMLKGVIDEGTGRNAKGIKFSAGKTGTTDNNMDAWFIGFTPTLATGVWMGHDQHKSLGHGETGGRAAAPIWLTFMKEAGKYKPLADFKIPAGITFIPISRETGEFEYLNTENALWEAFRKDKLRNWRHGSEDK